MLRSDEVTVKVQNLSKLTDRFRIQKEIPMVRANIIFVRNCPDTSANYAYVNCEDIGTALSVIDVLHHACLDNNILTAMIKGKDYPSSACPSQTSDHSSFGSRYRRRSPELFVETYSRSRSRSPISPRTSRTSSSSSRSDHFCPTSSTSDHSSSGSRSRPSSPKLLVERCSRSRCRSPTPSRSRRVGLDASSSTSKQYQFDKMNGSCDSYVRGETGLETGAHSSPSTSSGDTKSVKVSICGSGVTEIDLENYFSTYGTLANKIIIRQGQPNYAYVNFESNAAAQGACISSPHNINGTLVTAVQQFSKGATPTIHKPGLQLANAALPCNPLVIEKAQEDMANPFRGSKVVKIVPVVDKIVVHVPQKLAESAIKVFKKIIKASEANIVSTEISLNFCFYPILASQTKCQTLLELENKFDLKIEHNGKKLSLEQFRKEWKQIDNDIASQTTQPSSFTTGNTYHWYWFDDDTYRPYDSTVNGRIEAAFQSQTTTSVSIGSRDYIIDTASNQQINQKTYNAREIQRRQLYSVRKPNVTLHLTSHKDHIQEVERGIIEKLDSFIHETKVHLADSLQNLGLSAEIIITSASKNFVCDSVDEDNMFVIIRGTADRINQSKTELQTRIWRKERELGRTASIKLPGDWVAQDDDCELKMVPRGSHGEWASIEKRFLKPDFKACITKIERIQNKWLWEAYTVSKNRMVAKNGEDNERLLFHGTKSTPPQAIYNSEQGFDNRLASQGMYGEGAYFAELSSYSHNYAHTLDDGCKQMFLAKVITGMSYECQSSNMSLKAPPPKPIEASGGRKFEGERYDSVTAYTNGSRIYVIYELGRVYPAYLITYKTQTPEGLGYSTLFNSTQYKTFNTP